MTSAAELFRFGVVGVAATVIHYILAVIAVEVIGLIPLIAHVIAFWCAFPVSFAGHMYWTFREQTEGHTPQHRTQYWLRFFTTALIGLAAGQLVVFVAADVLSIHHRIAFAAALVLAPAVVFVLSKFWAFRTAA